MKPLNDKPQVRKGAIKSPVLRALLRYVHDHPECTAEQVSAFALAAREARDTLTRSRFASVPFPDGERLQWTRAQLAQLMKRFYIEAEWIEVPGDGRRRVYRLFDRAAFASDGTAATGETSIAGPCRIDLMVRDTYVPPRTAEPRAGSLAFKSLPSRFAGRAVAYVPGR